MSDGPEGLKVSKTQREQERHLLPHGHINRTIQIGGGRQTTNRPPGTPGQPGPKRQAKETRLDPEVYHHSYRHPIRRRLQTEPRMRAQLRALFGRRLDTRFCPRPFCPRPAGRDAPGSALLTYPSDETVATILSAIRDADPMDLARLQEAVDLSREDLKSEVAALNLEGMIDIVEGERLLPGRYRWFGDFSGEPEQRPTASERITYRGSRFLDSIADTVILAPAEPTALSDSRPPLQSPARPKDAIA